MTIKRDVTDVDRLVAGNIKRLRELQGIDRRALQEKAGIAFGILGQIETFHKPAGKSIQIRIVEALNCSLADLYKEGGAKKVRESGSPYFTNKQKKLLNAAEHLTDEELGNLWGQTLLSCYFEINPLDSGLKTAGMTIAEEAMATPHLHPLPMRGEEIYCGTAHRKHIRYIAGNARYLLLMMPSGFFKRPNSYSVSVNSN